MTAWRWALGASLAAHGALLGGLATSLPHAAAPRGALEAAESRVTPVEVTRVALASSRRGGAARDEAAPAAAPTASPGARPGPVPRQPEAALAEAPRGHGAVARPLDDTTSVPSAAREVDVPSAATGEAGPSPELAAGDGGAAAAPGAGGLAAGVASAASGAQDERSLTAAVHARLAEAAGRCYPQAARRFALSGTATVAFCTGPSGEAREARLETSSGAGVLDAAATGCVVAQASPFPGEAASRCFSVPVRFGAR